MFEIDNYHPLSSYSISKKRQSLMNQTMKSILYHPYTINNIFEPEFLKVSFQLRFEMDLYFCIRNILKSIYKDLNLSTDHSYRNIICKNSESIFSDSIGVDSYNFGWNIIGILFLRKEKILEKKVFFPIFHSLIQYFYRYNHLQPFYGKSVRDIKILVEEMNGNKTIQNYIKVEEWQLEEIYEYEENYPNSFLFMIQKLFHGYIRFWEKEKILKELKSVLSRQLHIPEINDLRCNNNLLYLYFNGKMKLPFTTKLKLNGIEENRLTDLEIDQYKNYSPSFREDKDTLIIDKLNKLHPDYKREFRYQGYLFTSITQCLHFRLLRNYLSSEGAYKNSFDLNKKKWDNVIQEKFKKYYYKEVNEKMKDIDYRISLLNTKENSIKNKDELEPITGYKENFLGRILEDIRKEMKEYLPTEHTIFHETIIYYLKYWMELWKSSSLEEKVQINFFFSFLFPSIHLEKVLEKDIIYPLTLKDPNHNDLIYSYLNQIVDKDYITLSSIIKVWKEFMTEECMYYLLKNIRKFHNYFLEIKKYFEILIPIEMVDFNDDIISNENLSILYYISLKYFLY